MTDFEHDLEMSFEWWTPNPYFEDDAEVDCEETAKNLTKRDYQKIVWHDVKKALPHRLIPVLGYNVTHQDFVVVSWDGVDWFDTEEICYNIDYWTELPKIEIER